MTQTNFQLVKSFPHLNTVDTEPKRSFKANIPKSNYILFVERTNDRWTIDAYYKRNGKRYTLFTNLSGDDAMHHIDLIIAYAQRYTLY